MLTKTKKIEFCFKEDVKWLITRGHYPDGDGTREAVESICECCDKYNACSPIVTWYSSMDRTDLNELRALVSGAKRIMVLSSGDQTFIGTPGCSIAQTNLSNR